MSLKIVNGLRDHKMVIVYHAHCADGIGAAWAAHCEFPYADVIPAGYQKELSEEFLQSITNAVVLIVDFSFDADNMRRICERAKYVELLDHHITALQKLVGFEAENFDMSSCKTERSGCGIVWEWLYGNEPMPPLLAHVEDRDLWLFKLPDTKQVMAGFFSYEIGLDVFDLYAYRTAPLKAAGEVALRIENQQVTSIIKHCKREWNVQGYKIAVVNCNGMFASEVGSRLAATYDFVITYFDDDTGGRKFSLRSKGDVNVANLCKKFGGGGHKNAAGFTDFVEYHSLTRLLTFMEENDLTLILKK